ncbi:DUF6681 family protein [Enterococcus sp. CSURQ0835]|uniref:DUF6681 family protein n=1 Tax=Enterococcus sp. CSURQ0835 TaxID=2681394 RepID=UPI00135AE1B5|nr:DUF6681 family protein [Enterococcus sp. CSURQ0835]
MSFILDIVNGLNKFLSYLDISPKYLNRGYTILSIIPTVYILRIVYGLWLNQNYVQLALYSLVFIALLYFLVLNVLYYFFDKNVKFDITQLFVKVLPEDAFNFQDSKATRHGKITLENTEEVAVDYFSDYQLKLAANMKKMIAEREIKTNDLSKHDGFLIEKNTLYPYYFVKPLNDQEYSLQIGRSYDELEEVGRIKNECQDPLKPIGLFITGGDFVKGGVRYHEPYHLKLMVKKETAKNQTIHPTATAQASTQPAGQTRASRRKHR